MVLIHYWTKELMKKVCVQSNTEVTEQEKVVARAVKQEETFAMTKILEAKYEPMVLDSVVKIQHHLSGAERSVLQKMLHARIAIFQGRCGRWKGNPVEIHMKEGSQPKTIRPYPIPQAYRDLVKKEVDRLTKIGLLTRVKEAEWSSPSFPIPKKNKTIRFVTDFRYLNTCIIRKPYPLPVIQDVLQSIGAFRWATCIELNMGYYSMSLNDQAKKILYYKFTLGVV